ncbi:MobP3 family relaxase [uncultured Oscillibacter sp.]|uniref:MobP3 family relaxase n=2 Tax=uncultured Oscillibacter sp. TaxID=876091 RepID=UPI00345BA584
MMSCRSAFITSALESHWPEVGQTEAYMKYIATRSRAERLGRHGLFGNEDAVDLEKAMTELSEYPGNVWTHIISLRREDAERLGYDNAKAWRNLLRTHRNEIAAAMNIPPSDFRWYAAFHDEGHHPHVHLMAWSAKPGQAYLNQEGIRKIKSELTRDIFQGELLHLYEQKGSSRDELVRQGRKALLELTKRMCSDFCDSPVLESKMLELAEALETVKGKKAYGYLKKPVKAQVDAIVDELMMLPDVEECYEMWWQLQCQVEDFYSEQERIRPPLSQVKELRAIKDVAKAVDYLTQSAEAGNQYAQYVLGKLYLQGKEVGQNQDAAKYWLTQSAARGNGYAQFLLDYRQRNPSVLLCTLRLLHHVSNIFWETLPPPNPAGGHVESKLMRRIREKKIAMGHKADDHEEHQGPSMFM